MSLRSADAVLWDCAWAVAAFAFMPLKVMAAAAAAPIISRITRGFTHFFLPFLPFTACAGVPGAASLLCLPAESFKKMRGRLSSFSPYRTSPLIFYGVNCRIAAAALIAYHYHLIPYLYAAVNGKRY